MDFARQTLSLSLLQEFSMPTQPINLVRSLLNLATGDFFSSAVASLFRAPTSRRESIWDMTNRICDHYFPERRPAIKQELLRMIEPSRMGKQ
jgi:hypothetical protein